MAIAHSQARALIDQVWEAEVLPALCDYIGIRCLSPAFDHEWRSHGQMDEAVTLIRDWCAGRPIDGLRIERVDLPDRTPVLLAEIPPTAGASPVTGSAAADAISDDATPRTVLLYGHLDKQPEMSGWREGLGPWTPVLDGERLYGRGGADDGYAAFAALTAIQAVHAGLGEHARCVVLVEASEESGSPDLGAYVDHLADRMGQVDLVICLDSGTKSYDRLWVTTSLRGMAAMDVRATVLTEGVHSGAAGGVVPSSTDVLRLLLDRIHDPLTGKMPVPELNVAIPAEAVERAQCSAEGLEGGLRASFPFAGGTQPLVEDTVERLLNQTWRPSMEVIAASGIPAVGEGGNVLRPMTELQLSFRLPPTADPDDAVAALRAELTRDPPFGATVQVEVLTAEAGWAAPPGAPWLADALDEASLAAYGQTARSMGEGGTIPFMAMLGRRFPDAQFVVAGVLGPNSNAHGPNEFLHVPYAKGLTHAVAHVLDAHGRHRGRTHAVGGRAS